MNLIQSARGLFIRFRYPVSLPQHIASALGVEIEDTWNFKRVLDVLTSPKLLPPKLKKFMTRDQAERLFKEARQHEQFGQKTLFSFYFKDGWLEFELQFDDQSKLRRVYLHHKLVDLHNGLEIPLLSEVE